MLEVAADWHEYRYRSTVCSHPLPTIADSGPVAQHDRHTTAPISRTRPSPVARRLLIINRPRRDGTLSWHWYSRHGPESNPRPRDRKSGTVPLGDHVKSSQVAFNKKAMTIALHVHNVQTIHNVQRDSKLCKLILTENNWNHQSYNTITRKN